MVAAVHVLEPGTRAGRRRDPARSGCGRGRWPPRPCLHDLGVIPMLSSDSQGMGRVGETVRRAFQCAAVMKAQRGGEPGAGRQRARPALPRQGHDQPRDRARPRGGTWARCEPGRLADLVLWRPALFPVRPELVLKAGMPAWGASGGGGATTMMVEPVQRRPADRRARARRPARVSLAFLAARGHGRRAPDDARARPGSTDCRELTAADMVRNGRTGAVVGRRRPPHRHARRGAALLRAGRSVAHYSGRYLL